MIVQRRFLLALFSAWVTVSLSGCVAPTATPLPTPSGASASVVSAPATPVARPSVGATANPPPAVAATVPEYPAPADNATAAKVGKPTVAADLVAPDPVRFEQSVARAGDELLRDARALLGSEPRAVVIDPLIDANTGAQTVSTAQMGTQLQGIVKTRHPGWSVQPLTRAQLANKPLLLIGTLTPVHTKRAVDTTPDAFRVWLTLIDLRTGKVVAKKLDRATVDSVNPEPLPYYRDSPSWHKDKTVSGYINSCQINTNIGDPADPEYLARLPAAAVVNEAILAYDEGKVPQAHKLYLEAQQLGEPGDLRVLNGLYITHWQLGHKDAARQTFDKIVASGLESKRLPLKLLFQPGKTAFNATGDLPQQYQFWLTSVAQETGKVASCVRVVGHTSRTGSARVNEALSRQRAEVVSHWVEQRNRSLSSRLSVAGVGSREALVGLGTDDMRDALDRRVEFRVVDCV
jgi:outer membrane protein OmpA-like peptidoglycan-associated protein